MGDLHSTGGVAATPAGSSTRGMQRVSSAGSLRHNTNSAAASGTLQYGGNNGIRQSDVGYQSQMGTGGFQANMGMGNCQTEMGMGGNSPGMLSRRSNVSSVMGSQRHELPCY